MKEVAKNFKISDELCGFIATLSNERNIDPKKIFADFADILRGFRQKNTSFLEKRDGLQETVNDFFNGENGGVTTKEVVTKLQELGYISSENSVDKVVTKEIGCEINPMAGPQLVVPADKVNMVLNAANARWVSLYNALYTSNFIDENLKNVEERKDAVREYTAKFMDKIISFAGVESWNEIESFSFDKSSKKFIAHTKNGETILTDASQNKLVGVIFFGEKFSDFIFENNGLKIEIKLNDEGAVEDILVESALTYIIDLEDASISAPENKYESYRILKGIIQGDLECEVRGKKRIMNPDTKYFDPASLEEITLKRTSLALVRDVGPHMLADENMITLDGQPVPEKAVDIFITSLIGFRYHVAPKMHGAAEVALNIELFDKINQAQGLPENANKIGIMNEEMRTNAQLKDSILAAKDAIFFTNTGFLDYTGSFIDLMMYQGAIAPYRDLPSKIYKTSYEKHNVNISLELGVAQIGAGMWAAINDMAGLLSSKEGQVRGLTDTGWSPSPNAAAIHVMAFHIYGNVRDMQHNYDTTQVSMEDLFEFPKADIVALSEAEIVENLDFAVHGLLAYAEPWVRRGIGCSGVKDLSGTALMEDRATARIKAAFIRNWLLHKVVSEENIEDSIERMAKLVDEQNSVGEGYKPLCDGALEGRDWNNVEEAVRAVRDVIFNPYKLHFSYVEPYFYPANRREN